MTPPLSCGWYDKKQARECWYSGIFARRNLAPECFNDTRVLSDLLNKPMLLGYHQGVDSTIRKGDGQLPGRYYAIDIYQFVDEQWSISLISRINDAE